MTKLDKLVTKLFIGPYILGFFLVEFVLVMQFLWKYIDDIAGKGFSIFELSEMIFYNSVKLIPWSLPLTILMGSVMTYGGMAERLELASFKSAGVSTFRLFRPALIIAILTAIFSIFVSDILTPKANQQFHLKFDSIRRAKPSLAIREKVFNTEFEDMAIWVDNKHTDGKTVDNIKLFDHSSSDKTVTNIIYSQKGVFYSVPNQDKLMIVLINGEQINELRLVDQKYFDNTKPYAQPMIRSSFDTLIKVLDLSDFTATADRSSIDARSFDVLSSRELIDEIDSIEKGNTKILSDHKIDFSSIISVHSDSGNTQLQPPNLAILDKGGLRTKTTIPDFISIDSVVELSKPKLCSSILPYKRYEIINAAKTFLQAQNGRIYELKLTLMQQVDRKNRFQLRLHQKFSWAVVCIIFLYIGAPMGSIVRKGGIGIPLLVSISFFMLFIILMILGEKLMRSGSIDGFWAAWLPCLVLVPISILLSIQVFLDFDIYLYILKLLQRSNTFNYLRQKLKRIA